jgi:CubicO group peptidase (beta-lactamase class C family)
VKWQATRRLSTSRSGGSLRRTDVLHKRAARPKPAAARHVAHRVYVAAMAVSAADYRPRDAEHAVLPPVIDEHLEALPETARRHADGAEPPDFVEQEFRDFLTCGVLAHGFARLRCTDCAVERLVPFSCKGRGFCPNCGGRRMTEAAARLVDVVLPRVPVRPPWVRAVPVFASVSACTCSGANRPLTRANCATIRRAVDRPVTRRSGNVIRPAAESGRLMSADPPGPPAGDVDRIFAKWNRPDSPGCALAVIQDGRIIYERGYGMADLDHCIPITASTVFHAASLSKQFTAMAIMLLAGQDKLSLDDDVRRYIGELPDLGVRMTVRHLLQHTSGLRDQWILASLSGWRLSDDVVTQDDVSTLVSRMKTLNYPPGTEFMYSNTGFTLAGEIVRRVSGTSLAQFVDNNIFTPLHMDASVIRERHGLIVRNHAYGYRVAPNDTFEVRMPNYDLVGPTNLLTTVQDLARWDANFDNATVGGTAALAQMQAEGSLSTGRPIGYGLGLFLGTYRGWRIVEHDGRDAGYRAHLIRFPEHRFSMASLCNIALEGPELPWRLLRRVADLYLAGRLRPPRQQPRQAAVAPHPEAAEVSTGPYWSPEAAVGLRIRDEAGTLRLEFDGDDALMTPLGGAYFSWSGSLGLGDVEIEVAPPVEGRPREIKMNPEYGGTMVFEALPTVGVPASALSEFEGRYYSDELDTAYRVVLEGASLVIRRKKFRPTTLLAASLDEFTVTEDLGLLKNGKLVFVRDGQHRINGFKLSGDRLRDLRFVKAPEP